jgi:glycosyltransferase involved in cell wall biosynthesis
MLDILYLAKNRLEFTKFSFDLLVANTDWSLVSRLVVVDDGSIDGTRPWLKNRVREIDIPCEKNIHLTKYGSPVGVMCHYLDLYESTYFAKIDNDIAVPPGWLEQLLATMERNNGLELLGMAAGWTGGEGCYKGWAASSHIGGVGLMRTSAFRVRPQPTPNGLFGFTEWQHHYEPVRGWVCPDIEAPELGKIPFEPWTGYSHRYEDLGWQRHWPPYDESSTRFWDWWK